MIKTVIADDHAAVRKGVRLALEADEFSVCAECADAPGAVKAALAHRPDVCLLDVDMPGDGITAAAEISTRLPDTAVVMLTASDDNQDLLSALAAGASGYLLKDTDPERLPLALKGVLRGEAAIPRALVTQLVDVVRDRSKQRALPFLRGRQVDLTDREWEVLELLRARLTTAEMAQQLDVSQVTVRRHVSGVLRKLGLPDRETAAHLLSEQ